MTEKKKKAGRPPAFTKYIKDRCLSILEDNGGNVAKMLKEFKVPLTRPSFNRAKGRDPLWAKKVETAIKKGRQKWEDRMIEATQTMEDALYEKFKAGLENVNITRANELVAIYHEVKRERDAAIKQNQQASYTQINNYDTSRLTEEQLRALIEAKKVLEAPEAEYEEIDNVEED